MKRPATLTIAVVLQWVAAVLAVLVGLQLITAAIELSDKDTQTAVSHAIAGSGLSDVSASMVVEALFIAGAVVLALGFLRVILAVYLARGRGWSRLVITVLIALNLITGVAKLFQEEYLQGVAILALEAIVLWLLYNPQSSAFIEAQSARPLEVG